PAKRQRGQHLRKEPAAEPELKEPGGETSGRRRSREHPDPEEKPRHDPGRVRVGQQRGPDGVDDLHADDEGNRAAEEKTCSVSRSPGPDHFWKKRKRLTAEGPREKKSPEMRGRAQSSSEAPPRSSG